MGNEASSPATGACAPLTPPAPTPAPPLRSALRAGGGGGARSSRHVSFGTVDCLELRRAVDTCGTLFSVSDPKKDPRKPCVTFLFSPVGFSCKP